MKNLKVKNSLGTLESRIVEAIYTQEKGRVMNPGDNEHNGERRHLAGATFRVTSPGG
jgi:hypothetical protein